MLKVFAISLVLSLVAGLAIGLLGKFFAVSTGFVLIASAVAALIVSFGYTLPAMNKLLGTGSSGGNTKVS